MKPDVTAVEVTPELDIFQYTEISGETKIDNNDLLFMAERWTKWLPLLGAYKLAPRDEGGRNMVLVVLPEEVEQEIDDIWQDSPTKGLALHNLAITMVMAGASELVSGLDDGRCAPLPEPERPLCKALRPLGLEFSDEGAMNRKYAVLTFSPHQGGCEICYLQEKCPRSTIKQ